MAEIADRNEQLRNSIIETLIKLQLLGTMMKVQIERLEEYFAELKEGSP